MDIEVTGYSIKRKIADGGMASVYLAVQDSLQRDVALKILVSGNDDTFRQRFLNEGRLLASLSHPNIITIYDIGIVPDGYVANGHAPKGHGYIAMEYLAGGDLSARLLQPMPAELARRLLKQLAEALTIVHRAGIVHRDIKPANILFRSDDAPVISDFGIARREQQDVQLTMDGYTVGSPAYSSPEQLQGKVVDARSDIYSLGVTFYQMLTASNPYSADSFADTIVNHLHMDVPALPAAIAEWQSLLDNMLAKSPANRYENCTALIDAIDALPAVVAQQPASLGTVALPSFAPSASERTVQSPLTPKQEVRNAATALLSARAGDVARPKSMQRWLGRIAMMALVLVIIAAISATALRIIKKHQLVQHQLALAEQRFAENKYLTPVDDNAVLYYQKVLAIDAENRAAADGLMKVATRYEELARKAFAANRYERGMMLVDKGLKVVPDHAVLLQLKKEQQALGHPTTRFFRNIFH
jgi:serine/threonine protein kinase